MYNIEVKSASDFDSYKTALDGFEPSIYAPPVSGTDANARPRPSENLQTDGHCT